MSSTKKATATALRANSKIDKAINGWYATEVDGIGLEHERVHSLAKIVHTEYADIMWHTQNGNKIKNSPDRKLKALAYTLGFIYQQQEKLRAKAIQSGGTRMSGANFLARLKMHGFWLAEKGAKKVPTIKLLSKWVAGFRATSGQGTIKKETGKVSRKPRQPNPANKDVDSIVLATKLKKLLDADIYQALVDELDNFIIKAKENKVKAKK